MEQGSPWTIGTGCGAGRSLAALPVAACRGGGRGGPSREDRRSDELGGARRERSGPWRLASRRSPRLGQPSGRGGGRGLERARPLATPGQRAGGGARRAARRAAAPARVCGPLLHSNTAAAVPGPATRAAMVGRLSLQDVPELVDTKKKGDGVLDSPDSGLPPSPSPSHWGLAATAGGGGERAPVAGTLEPDAAVTPIVPNPASLTHSLAAICSPRLCPLSFGEGVEFDPLPPKEIKYTSSVKYDSERHFIDDVQMPLGLVVASCSQTVTCIPNCTWRNYKAEVRFEPRPKPARFLSTTIVYPKYPKTVYTTTLDYNCHKKLRRFLSSVELEATEFLGSDGLADEC